MKFYMKCRQKLLSYIVNRQMKLFGHIVRKEELENLVGSDFVEEKIAQGRKRENYLR